MGKKGIKKGPTQCGAFPSLGVSDSVSCQGFPDATRSHALKRCLDSLRLLSEIEERIVAKILREEDYSDRGGNWPPRRPGVSAFPEDDLGLVLEFLEAVPSDTNDKELTSCIAGLSRHECPPCRSGRSEVVLTY